jgi:hypothetical protein
MPGLAPARAFPDTPAWHATKLSAQCSLNGSLLSTCPEFPALGLQWQVKYYWFGTKPEIHRNYLFRCSLQQLRILVFRKGLRFTSSSCRTHHSSLQACHIFCATKETLRQLLAANLDGLGSHVTDQLRPAKKRETAHLKLNDRANGS